MLKFAFLFGNSVARLFFNIGPFVTMEICPQVSQGCLNSLPNTNLSFIKLPKNLQNFAKVVKFCQIWSHCLGNK